MADQLSNGMNNMSLESGPAAQMGGGGQPRRSYIPPHMRGKMDAANGAPINNGPANGLNQSAWAG